MPTAAQPLADAEGKPSQVWWRFWYGLLTRSAATVTYLVATALTATGTAQADALQLTAEWNELTTVAANTGVVLFDFGAGLESTVWNAGANSLKVYPPVGSTIDGGAANDPYVLAAGKAQVFYQLDATSFRTLQLG
jgi:hypothetical protein